MHVFRKRLLFLLGAVIVLLLASFTYHRLALQREEGFPQTYGANGVCQWP